MSSVQHPILARIYTQFSRNQKRALEEIQQVLRPGGELRFFEHLRSHHHRLARAQTIADRIGRARR